MSFKKHLLDEAQNAENDYNKRRSNIDKLLSQLNKKLAEHENGFAHTDYKGWGYVGDLGNVENKLKEIVDFLK